MLSNHSLSFEQALALLTSLGPGSPYRLALITCWKAVCCSQLVEAWQQDARLLVVKFEEFFPGINRLDPDDARSQVIARINRLVESKDHLALVLENPERSEDQVVLSLLSWLVDYLPDNLTLVITGRHAPQIPLSRLRVRRQVIEIELDG